MKNQIQKKNNFKYIGTRKTSEWIIRSLKHRFNILIGSVRSGKDYNATIAFIETVKAADFDLFLVGAVDVKNSFRIVGRYILDYLGPMARKTIYLEAPAIQFEYNGMLKTIIFAGGHNKGSDAGIQGITVHSVYFTEINLLNTDFISQAIKRTSSFKDAKIFGTMNPRGLKHWFRREYLDVWSEYQKNNPDKEWLNLQILSLFDNPILDEETIEQIKASYDPTSVSYKRDILAMESDPEGAVYTLREYNRIKVDDLTKYKKYSTVIDPGESISATAFQAGFVVFNEDKKQFELHIIKEYHHINKKLNDIQKKHTLDYIDDYVKFILECVDIFGTWPENILYDGTDQFARDLKKKLIQNNISIKPKYVVKEEEEERIYMGQSWLHQGKLRFDNNCIKTIEDFTNIEYDEKAYERTGKMSRKEEYNDYGHHDMLDCSDYLMTWYKKIIK